MKGDGMDPAVRFSGKPMVRRLSLYVIVFALGVVMGVMGEVALSDWTRPPNWLELRSHAYYLGIILTAVGFGPEFGGRAAILAGLFGAVFTRTKQSSTRTGAALSNAIAPGDPAAVHSALNLLPGGRVPPGFAQALRIPLSDIESAGYILEDSVVSDEDRRELASIILKECGRLDVLIRPLDVLQCQSPVHREIDFSALLDEIVTMAESVTRAASITLCKGECPQDLSVTCDPALIEVAVLNLLANAVQNLEAGDEVTLSGIVKQHDAVIELSHRDAGVLGQIQMTMETSQSLLQSRLRMGAS